MDRSRERAINKIGYYPSDLVGICALCGNDTGAVHFKGRVVCEECLDIVKEMY
jgi:hypothetical protein